MYDSGVAGVEPPVSMQAFAAFGIAVVARHDSVTTHEERRGDEAGTLPD